MHAHTEGYIASNQTQNTQIYNSNNDATFRLFDVLLVSVTSHCYLDSLPPPTRLKNGGLHIIFPFIFGGNSSADKLN